MKIVTAEMADIVVEELQMSGYNAKVSGEYNNLVTVEDAFVKVELTMSEPTVMANMYRCINHYGIKLSAFGLKSKLKELKQ